MSCPDCTQAAARDWHGFTADCPGCAARAVARGPNYRESLATSRQTSKYRAELDLLKVSHEQVKAAAGVDAIGAMKAAAEIMDAQPVPMHGRKLAVDGEVIG